MSKIIPFIPPSLRCPQCAASMYKSGESATYIRYRCLSGKHTVVQLKPRKRNTPNDAA